MTESAFRRLLLRFALVPVVSIFGLLAVLGVKMHQLTETRAEASGLTSILLQSDDFWESILDQETGIRGYLAGRDTEFLQPYYEGSGRIGEELSALTSMTASHPTLAAKMTLIAAILRQFNAVNQSLLQRDLPAESVVPLLKQQKQAMDSLRAVLAGLNSEEMDLREKKRRDLNTLYDTLPAIGVAGGIVIAAILVIHGIILFRELTSAFRRQLNETEIQRDSLHTTLHSIGDAVIVCDRNGLITLMNPTAEEVTAWNKAEAIGQPLDSVFHILNEHSREPIESPVAKVLRIGQVVGLANHTVLIRRDGSEVSIDDSGAPIRDRSANIVGVVLVFRDIEARRKAERELEVRTAELESMLFHSPAGFASFDRKYQYLRVNRAMAQYNGIPVQEHIGRNLSDIAPQNLSIVGPIIDQVFATRTAIQQEIVGQTALEPGVDRQWFSCFYPVMTEHRDDPVSVGVIAFETTDRWRAQESMLRSEKLAAVGRLAASIAHEMNNPLASVTNLLYLIALDNDIQGQTREWVERANIELARVSNVARQTLRFAKRSTAAAKVDLNEVAGSVLLLFSSRITQNQIDASIRVRGTPQYFGYGNELMQLLTNLVSNSLDAMSRGGKLIIGLQQTRDWKTGREGVSISVADSGSGIPEFLRKKVWEPFFTTKPDTGTGLGLWIVDEMVKKDGGTVRMRTATEGPRSGATFRIYLPSEPAAQIPG